MDQERTSHASEKLPAELSPQAAAALAADLARQYATADRARAEAIAAAERARAPRALQLSTQDLIRLRASFTGYVGLLGLLFVGLFAMGVVWSLIIAVMTAISGGGLDWNYTLLAALAGLPALVVGVAFLALARPLGRRLIPFKPGRLRCPRCRYDLRALSAGRCPECGYQVDPPEPAATISPSAAVQRVRLVVGAVVNIVLVVGLIAFWIYQAMFRMGMVGGSGSRGRGYGEAANEQSVEYYAMLLVVTLGLLLLIALNAWLVRFLVPMEIAKPVLAGSEGADGSARENARA